MTFPNKKRIKTGLFIDRTSAPYKVDGHIKDEHVVRVFNDWHWLIRGLSILCAKSAIRYGHEQPDSSLF